MHTETSAWKLLPAINLLGELGSADNKTSDITSSTQSTAKYSYFSIVCHNPSPIRAACHLNS